MIAPGATGLALAVAFVLVEARAAEPLLSLRLFANRVISTASAASVLLGAVVFSVMVYLPLYVQGVLGASAVSSGLALLPLLVGWSVTAAVMGQLVSHTDRYDWILIVGSSLIVGGFVLLSLIGLRTSGATIAVDAAVIGVGFGFTAQVYVIAAQDAVAPAQVGEVTAAISFFRTLGGSFAVTGLGAVMTGRIAVELSRRLGGAAHHVNPNLLLQGGARVPRPLVHATREAMAVALHAVFVVDVPIAAAMLALAVVLPGPPLRRVIRMAEHPHVGPRGEA